MNTNSAVIRRIMSGLRDQGYVRSEKGHGGGWSIACDLDRVTLRDVYDALGQPGILAMGNRTDAPVCLIEQTVNAALGDAFDEAEAVLLRRFGKISLAALSADFHARLAQRASRFREDKVHEA
jgi:DNA-binding IscR family transcriptional regulator